jgi:hypothetical protein
VEPRLLRCGAAAAGIGWRWVDRTTFRMAYDLNSQDFSTLSGHQVDRIGYNWIN